jgi:hypothetical protein
MRFMDMLDCSVIGDVLIDVVVHGKSYLGNLVPSGTSYCSFAKIEFGGSGNVAVGLSALGGRAAFVGKAGNDFFGKLYVEDLKKRGVIPRVVLDRYLPTGVVIVFLDQQKERSFLVFRGANDEMSPKEVEKASSEIKRSRYMYFSGYSLINRPQEEAILWAVDLARKHKLKIVFDPGAHNIVKSKKRLFTKLLSFCDVFSPNLEEASAITSTTRFEDIVEKLREKVPFTALKLGKDGSLLISGKETVTTQGLKVRCMDTTGAGDAFIAAIIYGLSRKLPLAMIGRMANWFSAQAVTQMGSRSFPSKSRILHFLDNNSDS